MAGFFKSNKTDPNLTIERWLINVVQKSVNTSIDLHVDDIDNNWRLAANWLTGGLESLRLATPIRDKHAKDLVLALAFSLRANDEPRGVDFRSVREFQDQLDWSPPSLYLFDPGKEPWTVAIVLAEQVHIDGLSVPVSNANCYYLEYKQPDDREYSRTVFIAV